MQFWLLSWFWLFIGTTLCSLKIYSPNYLAAKYESVPFIYHLSSFGKIPYGHTIMGNLRIPFPETGCGNNVKVDYDPKNKDPLILVMMRGNCSFLEKVQNGQNLKASLVIVVDDKLEDMKYVVPFAEDAPHLNIQIPSIMIDNASGKMLMDDIKKISMDGKTNIVSSFSFTIIQSLTSVVFYKFDLNDRDLYELFFELMNFYPNLKKHVFLAPGYNIAPFYGANKPSSLFCLNVSHYCEQREDQQKVTRENEPLFESIRQLCLSRAASETWWKYVSAFYMKCQDKDSKTNKTILSTDLKKCSDNILKEINDPEAISKLEQCMSGIQGDNVDGNSNLHKYLAENYNLRSMVESPIRPSIMINGQVIYGRLTSLDVLKEICASLLTKPDECHQIDKMTTIKVIQTGKFTFLTALWYLFKLLLIGIVATGAFYLVYKLKLRKDMEKKLTTEVDSALANYYMQNRTAKYEGVAVDDSATQIDDPDVDEDELK